MKKSIFLFLALMILILGIRYLTPTEEATRNKTIVQEEITSPPVLVTDVLSPAVNESDKSKHGKSLKDWDEMLSEITGNTEADQKSRLIYLKECSDDGHLDCSDRLKESERLWQEPRCARANFNFALHLARDRPEIGFPVVFALNKKKFYGVPEPLVTGSEMTAAMLGKDASGNYRMRLYFSERARGAILEGTDFNKNQALCLVVGGSPISCPIITEKLDTTVLHVGFREREAKDIESIFKALCNNQIEIPELPY